MSKQQDDDARVYGMVSIAMPAERVTRPAFGKHGFAGGALVVDWPAIVGSAVAAHTLPMRIKFPPKLRDHGVLVIKVDSGAFATELQHLEPLVVERINGYFGWQAVERLQLQQGPLPRPKRARPQPAASKPPSPSLQARLDAVDDPELRAALERLASRLG
ncbi:MAG: DUF721 domain-containing protein [Actinomycetota bacterium]